MAAGSPRPGPLVDQAAQHLREQIADGRWPVGARLPGEAALAASLGVGRSTVREAVRALAGAGLLRTRQGAGVFVIATEPVEEWSARLGRAAAEDVHEVRALLEAQAVRLAARRRTDEDIAALKAALADRQGTALAHRQEAAVDVAACVDADLALHAALVAAAHNRVLTDLFAEFAPALRDGLLALGRRPGPNSHEALVAAVISREPDSAERLVRSELGSTARLLRETAQRRAA